MKSNKKIRRLTLQPLDRTPYIPTNIGKDLFRWGIRSDYIDWNDKDFGFHRFVLRPFFRMIKPRLDEFSRMTWSDIQSRKSCHPMAIECIRQDCIKRLQELFGDNMPETLYQIDMPGQSQKYRIWGRKENGTFYLIWNDPNHEVYPVSKKHT